MELMMATVRHDSRRRGLVERMCKVVFRCVQQRPSMSAVVKILEGETEITPPSNPFRSISWSRPVAKLERN